MKKNALILLTICLLTVILSSTALCQGKNTGIGIILGEPTGFSSKVWWDDNIAFDCGLAWSITDDPDLHIHGDVLWHNWKVLDDYFEIDDSGRLPLYYGIGGRIKAGDDTRVGMRFIIGVSYILFSMLLRCEAPRLQGGASWRICSGVYTPSFQDCTFHHIEIYQSIKVVYHRLCLIELA